MTRLLIAGGRVVDPLNNLDGTADDLIEASSGRTTKRYRSSRKEIL